MEEIREFLGQVDLFERLPESQIDAMSAIAKPLHYEKGEPIFF